MENEKKIEKIEIKVTPAEKESIRLLAAAQGLKMSQYILQKTLYGTHPA